MDKASSGHWKRQLPGHTCGKRGAITGPVTSSSRSNCTSTTTGPPLWGRSSAAYQRWAAEPLEQGTWPSGSPADAVLIHNFVRQLNVRVAVTETGHVCHLAVRQLKQCVPFFILHLHDVENTLHSLQQAFRDQGEKIHTDSKQTGSTRLLISILHYPSSEDNMAYHHQMHSLACQRVTPSGEQKLEVCTPMLLPPPPPLQPRHTALSSARSRPIHLVCATFDVLRSEMRQLFQV